MRFIVVKIKEKENAHSSLQSVRFCLFHSERVKRRKRFRTLQQRKAFFFSIENNIVGRYLKWVVKDTGRVGRFKY